eukprot:357932_1
MMQFKIGGFSGAATKTTVTSTITFSTDGVLIKAVKQSTGSSFGHVFGQWVGTMIDTTAAISDFMGLFDNEKDDYYLILNFNPITVIFVGLLILLTSCIGFSVYLVSKYCFY